MENFNVEKFRTPQEEIAYLKERLKEVEKTSSAEQVIEQRIENAENSSEQEMLEQLREYKESKPEEVVSKEMIIPAHEVEKIVLNLSPEKHDDTISELLGIVEERGVKNALSVAEKMNNPHLEDDFHRVLVQYIKSGYVSRVAKKEDSVFDLLRMTLYEVSLPKFRDEENKKSSLAEIVAPMEQFYAGMMSISGSKNGGYFTIEFAVSAGSDDLVMYVAVPDDRKDLFEKQLLSVFPDAMVKEKSDDYNIFENNFAIKGSNVMLYKKPAYTLKTYEDFVQDPLAVILNSFSKLPKEEGASVQLVVSASDSGYNLRYQKALEKIKKGEPVERALSVNGVAGEIAVGFGDFFFGSKKDEKEKPVEVDQTAVENIQKKISQPILNTNIRILISSQSETRADAVLTEIESSLNQLENTTGNKFYYDRPKGSRLKKMLHNFSFRIFDSGSVITLNLKELATIFHFQSSHIKSTGLLKQSKSATASAPMNMAVDGVLLGLNNYRGAIKEVRMSAEDRLRHFYVIGQTGTGKTTLLKNMIVQDIKNGEGVCMIDPHGSDIDDILGSIPKERFEDVIYFDPSHIERPFALNMLEYDKNKPEQKTFVVNEMLSIFNKLFDMKTAGGPMFEQYFRQAVLLTIDHPESGNTLSDVSRVLSDKDFRDMKLAFCKNENVVRFWRDVAEKAGGESSLQNIVPYITSKFDIFLSNEIMRPIVTQQKSSINFRDIMDNKKILLVNLSKGKLGDINSSLIGLIIVGKILMAALSRVDSDPATRSPFYLYIDEFQNITTDSISTILSEARKYKLSLNVAHQFIKQLDEGIKNSVFGNVGSMATFRVSAEDAEYLEKQFGPTFTAKDIMNLDNRNAYLKVLVNGQPASPFNIETVAPVKGDWEVVQALKELSYVKYGKKTN